MEQIVELLKHMSEAMTVIAVVMVLMLVFKQMH